MATLTSADAAAETPVPGLRRVLRAVDYFAIAFGTMVGTGWLLSMGRWLDKGGPYGAICAFALSGVIFAPVAAVYAHLIRGWRTSAAEVAFVEPLSRRVAFVSGWSVTLMYTVIAPWESIQLGKLAAYLFPALDTIELYGIGGEPIYLWRVLIGVSACLGLAWLNWSNLRMSAMVQRFAVFLVLASAVGLLVLSMVFSPEHREAGSGFAGSPISSTISMVVVAPFFLAGFEVASKCHDESVQPTTNVAGSIYTALVAGVCFYVLMIVAVMRLAPWHSVAGDAYAVSDAAARATGFPLVGAVIVVIAFLSSFKCYNGSLLTASRMIESMHRREYLRPGLRHALGGAGPRRAVFCICGIGAVGAFLGPAMVEPLTDVGSMAVVLAWLGSTVAVWSRAARPTRNVRIAAAVAIVVCVGCLTIMSIQLSRVEWAMIVVWYLLGAGVYRARAHVAA